MTAVFLAVLLVAGSSLLHGHMQEAATGPNPAFEVASVKVNRSGDVAAIIDLQPGNRFLATNIRARSLIASAYRLQEYQVVGGPAWLDSDRFDILAKAPENQPFTFPGPGGPPPAQQLMLRALLADRFSVVVHADTRELPGYRLVVARADGQLGPLIRSSTTDCSAQTAPPLPGQRPICGTRLIPGSLSAGNRTLAQLAGIVSQFVRRPVSDATGLAGTFDFDLTWTPDPVGNMPPENVAAVDPDRPRLFTALQEQLGLRLQAVRDPLPVLVVDRAEKPGPD
jgi:uncharacterized protein (TIGR03435 family)